MYVADIESHEATRSTMNESAYYVISKAGGTPYAGAVAEKQKHLNDRWRALCQQLGITYKKAEETRYGLKLLEIQLKQLNTWMTELESRLVDFTVARLCVVAEIHKKVKEMKVKLKKSDSQRDDILALCRIRSHGTKKTKKNSGTLKSKDVSILNDLISLFFLPLSVACPPASCFCTM